MIPAAHKPAYDAVRRALRNGTLVRATACSKCGRQERAKIEGRAIIQAHHEDYSKPLDVIWLCARCHRKITRLPVGEDNGVALLSSNLVQAASLLHKEGFALAEIADFYGVSRQCVSHAVTGKNWLAERSK